MRILKNPAAGKTVVTLVACLHGDETFGLEMVAHYEKKLADFPGLCLIVANEPAVARGVRYVSADLNRIFPGEKNGADEFGIAYDVLAEIRDSQFVLDMHNTTSEIAYTPIITDLNNDVKKIINLSSSAEVVHMHPPLGLSSLIHAVPAGVSLEFNFDYARTREAREEVCRIVEGLLSGAATSPKLRRMFHVSHVIPNEIVVPTNVTNFIYDETLGGYPFLLYERSYHDMQGFLASTLTWESL